MELYNVVSIINRDRANALLKIYEELKLSAVFTHLGTGTATAEHLSFYDLAVTEKAVISTVASAPTVRQLMRAAKRKLYIDIPGNGIILSIPIKSIGGGRALAYLTDGQSLEGEKPNMNFENELIIVILNEGYSDMVMDAARAAGATGGTVMHAKGTGAGRAEKFFGVSLAEEKDFIYILASASKKTAIMKAILNNCGETTKAAAVCFSLPVSEVAGIRRLEDD